MGTGRRSGDTAGEGFLPRDGGGGGGARLVTFFMSDADIDVRSALASDWLGRSSPPTDARVRWVGRSGVKSVWLLLCDLGGETETAFSCANCSNLDFRLLIDSVGADSISELSAIPS